MSARSASKAEIPSSARKMMPVILGGLFSLTLLHISLKNHFASSETILGLPPVSPEFCSETPCYRSDLFAFQVSSGVSIFVCGLLGFRTWHISKRHLSHLPSTPEGRLFGFLPESEWLAAVNFTFQFWDFLASCFIAEHATPLFLIHHLMASTVSWFSIRYTFLHYYGVFFLGCSEFSSIFLLFVDVFKFFPPAPGTTLDLVKTVFGGLFALSFLYYRVLLWWPVSYQLYRDILSVRKSGKAEQLRPGMEWVLLLYLGLNLPLGILQLYWLSIILGEVAKVLA